MQEVLSLFSRGVRDWFVEALGEPTYTQQMGWMQLAKKEHAMICAPTGSGKTLCAFLLALDGLLRQAEQGTLESGVQVLYISPLKALGNDIARNLDLPLEGIARHNKATKSITKAIRTGDTEPGERRRQLSKPPHILITTPESLYLLLTSKGGATMFTSLKTVIVDEVHALLESKRGTHLTLSLERLREYSTFQRIGLTATVEPQKVAAAFLGGSEAVHIVDARGTRCVDLLVQSPVHDFRSLPENTVWPEIGKLIYSSAKEARQTLVFCNGRMVAENVCTQINRVAGGDFARTHHGSLDKERRRETECDFKQGTLRCLCATSSMELGIDIGSVDIVFQVGSPVSASRGLQRMGRSGHRPGEVSVMRIVPRVVDDILESAFLGRMMLNKEVEPMRPPKQCLDVLAQHIVSMVCTQTWTVGALFRVVSRSFAYQSLSMDELKAVLRLLRGDFEHAAGRTARPRILWNESTDEVMGDAYSRMLAVSGSTIPDKGLYPVVTTEGVRLGELDEEFVFEARIGDRFTLGAFVWAIVSISHDRVIVSPSRGVARAPFWRGEGLGRPSVTGESFGREMAHLERSPHLVQEILNRYPIDESSARAMTLLLEKRLEQLSCLPTDTRVIVEHFRDESGECFWALHCLLGGRVNLPLSLALRQRAAHLTGRDVKAYHTDDGVMLHLIGEQQAPVGLLASVDIEGMREALLKELPATPLFAITFRHAAAIALMLGSGKGGKRIPLWAQRLRGAEALSRASEHLDHPLVVEAYRECLTHIMEVERAQKLLRDVQSGRVEVVEVHSEKPSHLTQQLRFMAQMEYTYYEANLGDVTARGPLAQEKNVVPEEGYLQKTSAMTVSDKEALYIQLLRRGTLLRDEVFPSSMMDELHAEERAVWVEGLLVASHESEALRMALSGKAQSLVPFVLRWVRSVGETLTDDLVLRFGPGVGEALSMAQASGDLSSFVRHGRDYWIDSAQLRRAMVFRAREKRKEIQTQPMEHYASLVPLWQRATGETPLSRMEDVFGPLYGYYAQPILWEQVILPARIQRFRSLELDHFLMTGSALWRVKDSKVAFFPSEEPCSEPERQERSEVYNALLDGKALFARQIAQKTGLSTQALEAELVRLVHAGLITCDGFAPFRKREAPRNVVRSGMRFSLLSGEGRWEAAGMPCPPSPELQLKRLALRWGVLSRESALAEGVAWGPLLDVLKRMEYRDEVRRGYFVRGLSGAQFVLEEHFERFRALLANPSGQSVLCALDPAQVYGSCLPGAGFSRILSTAVVAEKGRIVLVAKSFAARLVFADQADYTRPIQALAQAFQSGRLWPQRKRITVREYPQEAKDALKAAGFAQEIMDYTLWRG